MKNNLQKDNSLKISPNNVNSRQLNSSLIFSDNSLKSERSHFKYKDTKKQIGIMMNMREIEMSMSLDTNNSLTEQVDSKLPSLKLEKTIQKYNQTHNKNVTNSIISNSKIKSSMSDYNFQSRETILPDLFNKNNSIDKKQVKNNEFSKIEFSNSSNQPTPQQNKPFNLNLGNGIAEQIFLPKPSLKRKTTFIEEKTDSKKRSIEYGNINDKAFDKNLSIDKQRIKLKNKDKEGFDIQKEIELQICKKLKDNVQKVENWIKKVYDKMCYYDSKLKKLSRISDKSLQLYIVRQFHPDCCDIILKFLKFDNTKRLNREEMVAMLVNPQTWPGKKIFELSFNIQNTNEVGNIDQNDLITYLKSIQCSTNQEQFMTEDILTMVDFMENKRKKITESSFSGVETYRSIKKSFRKEGFANQEGFNPINRNQQASMIDRMIKKVQNNKLADDHGDQITYEEQEGLSWEPFPGKKFGLPKVISHLIKILTGVGMQENEINDSMIDENHVSYQGQDLAAAREDFSNLCNQININPTKITNEQQSMMFMEDSLTQWRIIVNSFQSLCDQTKYRITKASLLDKFSTLLGEPGMVKITERLQELISKGQPINLFKYVHFIFEQKDTDVKLLWKFMDFNGDQSVGFQEVEFFSDIFAKQEWVLTDMNIIAEQLKQCNATQVQNFNQFGSFLKFKSRMQNFIWMILQNDQEWRKQGHTGMVNYDEKRTMIINFYDAM